MRSAQLASALSSLLFDPRLLEIGDRFIFRDSFGIKDLLPAGTFVPVTFVGNHDVTRIASQIEDVRHLEHAIVILFTVGGTPCIYYGDEQAFRGIKEHRAGGDDAIRPQFPEQGPAGLAPFGGETYRLHQQLTGLRRRNPWLHSAKTTSVQLSNAQFRKGLRAA